MIVEIEYTRPPDRVTTFRQQLVHAAPECTVTCLEHAELKQPVRARGAVILEPGAPVVWFTFPGAWHDIGRFHTADGRFTGFYANVLTPVEFVKATLWRTTDLFLDVWLDAEGVTLLDEEELEEAVRRGDLAQDLARTARAEAGRLQALARDGAWPPPICRTFTLEHARALLRGTRGGTAV